MPSFDTTFQPDYGTPVPVARHIERLTAPNPGALTFLGTNTYLVGERRMVVVDPGPDDSDHLAAIERAIGDRPLEAILLTHTHRDHCALTDRLRRRTGAPLIGGGPHRPSRPAREGEEAGLKRAGDSDLTFERLLADGDRLTEGDCPIEAVATPGHAANHLAFAIGDEGALLSGDHVMGWSTTVIAPPDGSMADYMASLERLLTRDDRVYLPGHGGPVAEPRRFVRSLILHRRMRERTILEALDADGEATDTIAAITDRIYPGIDSALRNAARLSVLAHLEHLVEQGRVTADGDPPIEARYRVT